MYQFTRRLRDKLAVEINNGTIDNVKEFKAVCEFLTEVGPHFRRENAGPPPGVAERRRAH